MRDVKQDESSYVVEFTKSVVVNAGDSDEAVEKATQMVGDTTDAFIYVDGNAYT